MHLSLEAALASNVVIRLRDTRTGSVQTTTPLVPTPRGISIGTESQALFHCNHDPLVSAQHGTLDCTLKFGIWVYVDHSSNGTILNETRTVHQEAVIVRPGDRLFVGNTEMELFFEENKALATSPTCRENDNNQHIDPSACCSATPAAGSPTAAVAVAPASKKLETPQLPNHLDAPLHFHLQPRQRPEAQVRRPQQQDDDDDDNNTNGMRNDEADDDDEHLDDDPRFMKSPRQQPQRDEHLSDSALSKRKLANIITSGHRFQPEFIDSPVAFSSSRRKRPPFGLDLALAATTAPTTTPSSAMMRPVPAMTSTMATTPQTPPQQHVTKPCSIPFSPQIKATNDARGTACATPPPPLEYSSSPVSMPSFMLDKQFPNHAPAAAMHRVGATGGVNSPFRGATKRSPEGGTARRDDLRIQVSKKMAGFIVAPPNPNSIEGANHGWKRRQVFDTHRGGGNQFFGLSPPASPVAHQDILRQKQSLLQILQNKNEQEQLLKQQQEEWLRTQQQSNPMDQQGSSSSSSSTTTTTNNNNNNDHHTDHHDNNQDMDMDVTQSESQRHPRHQLPESEPEEPLVTNRFKMKHQLPLFELSSLSRSGEHEPQQRLTPSALSLRSPLASCEDVDSSVASTASTVIACYRRITRSISSCHAESSGELNDFVGYEEELDASANGLRHLTSFSYDDEEEQLPTGGAGCRVSCSTSGSSGVIQRSCQSCSSEESSSNGSGTSGLVFLFGSSHSSQEQSLSVEE